MRRALMLTVAVLLFSAGTSRAATPVAPASGSSLATTDVVTFEAQPTAAETDEDYLFVFSELPDFTANQWFGLVLVLTNKATY